MAQLIAAQPTLVTQKMGDYLTNPTPMNRETARVAADCDVCVKYQCVKWDLLLKYLCIFICCNILVSAKELEIY